LRQIDIEHPEYIARKHVWRAYRDLYAGGEQIKQNAATYLVQRQKEPADVYRERLSRVFYENYLGSIVDWYGATLFRREPLLLVDGNDERAKAFVNSFVEDCDCKGTSLSEFFRKLITEAMITGSSYVMVDFPRMTGKAATRAEEEERGAARAYLVDWTAEQLINWSHDPAGSFEWVVLRQSSLRKDTVAAERWIKETRWLYYDKQQFQIYRRMESETGAAGEIERIDQGLHGLAASNRVPLFSVRVPEGLWLMNKAGLLQLEHFNKSNALGWALTMGLFATPVIYSDREWDQVVGESYYIQLGQQDRFGWTEPEGKVYQVAAENLKRLQEEIYRVCYLLTQAGGPMSGGSASGLSKQRDYAITQEVLRAYGDVVKETMKRILRAIVDARQDRLGVDVSGMDEFDIGDFSAELADAERLLALGIPSTTLKRQVFKKLSAKYLSDVRQEVKDQIGREIDCGVDSVLNKDS